MEKSILYADLAKILGVSIKTFEIFMDGYKLSRFKDKSCIKYEKRVIVNSYFINEMRDFLTCRIRTAKHMAMLKKFERWVNLYLS